jgi:Uma2 family endonuclease
MIASPIVTAKWAIADYHQMIASGILSERCVELLAGEIVEMSPESPLHTVYGEGLANYLRQCLSGRAWVREARPITLSDSEPEPDIAIVRLPWFQYREHHPYPDDIFWVIEISDSTLVKDLTVKQQIYAQAGIAEYWVLEIQSQKVTLFRDPSSDGYNNKQEFEAGNVASLAFPDVEISLESIFSGEILN